MSLPSSAAVVVIGGGVIGASVAHHLAAQGARDIVVLDRAEGPGLGSTGKATGGFRAQYGTAINVRLSLLSREKLMRFEEETGVDPGYEQAGYLWLAGSQASLETLRAGNRMQREEGLGEAAIVSREEIARINPSLNLDEIVGGAFCPTDGFIRPLPMLDGYRGAAGRAGVRFAWSAEVLSMERDTAGRVSAVNTARGRIATDAVVNAAGAWARDVAAMAGVDLPVTPLRRQVVPTVATNTLPSGMPMSIWADDGFHLRVRDGRVLLLWPTPGEPKHPFATRVDPSWIDDVVTMARARVPSLREIEIDREAAWAGLYEISPDKHAILGKAVECPNLWLANGSSGHGIMHAPALGQLLAEMMLAGDGRAVTLDAHALRPGRFAEGEAIAGPALL
jgi:sarcosine oxidase subunit beta